MQHIPFNNSYVALGTDFYVKTDPISTENPKLIKFNSELAAGLGLIGTAMNSTDGTAIFAGNLVPSGAEPLAMAYAGHQFGHFNPQLGDGRAVLLGEIISSDGNRFDIQLKGSGQTPFSRAGDGRSSLGPVLREYLVSETMAKLGVPTTRALAAVTSGEQVAREQLLPGGVLTRIATSFVRVGTFQYFSARDNVDAIRTLTNYVIDRNYPQVRNTECPYEEFLKTVVDRQAALIAQWMQLGFIHGVMNTDNMSIAAETIDYGPCAFMDAYNHDQVYSFIDRNGRYAYGNQPSIGLWNLTRLAESLLPLLADDPTASVEIAQNILGNYSALHEDYWLDGMQQKLGLSEKCNAGADRELIENLFDIMAANKADFTLTFHYLSQLNTNPTDDNNARNLFSNPEEFDQWALKWRKRLSQELLSDDARKKNMRAVNPVYIPRNHQIEAAIRAAEDHGDFSPFHSLYEILQNPYTLQPDKEAYMLPPQPDEVIKNTFCGT